MIQELIDKLAVDMHDSNITSSGFRERIEYILNIQKAEIRLEITQLTSEMFGIDQTEKILALPSLSTTSPKKR